MNVPEGVLAATGAEKTYFDFLGSGVWKMQRCQACGKWVFYPREYCPHCQSPRLQWLSPSGLGTVYSMSKVASKDGNGPLIVLVDLDEGVRIMGGADDVSDEGWAIGARVSARLDTSGAESRILFAPKHGEQHEAS